MSRSERNPEPKAQTPRRPRKVAGSGDTAFGPGDFPVVGLGASAGALEALGAFFDAMPSDSGMAFVVVQHLDPSRKSLMAELLARHTAMKVLAAEDGAPVRPDHVYVIPPAAYLEIREGSLCLSKPKNRHGARMPVDFFFRSLAEDRRRRAICVVLSGAGTDGTLGLRAVKEHGGLAVVQDPKEAGYDSMPRSALTTGAVDLVLAVKDMPQAIIRYCSQSYVYVPEELAEVGEQADENINDIINLLRSKTAHDFLPYKIGTIVRRIERRMAINYVDSFAEYLRNLTEDPVEIERLAKDLLINVTSFFRHPESFEVLAKQVLPDLVKRHGTARPFRVWVPGCSTGEEAYSIAMLLIERISAIRSKFELQVFATDVDEDAVEFGRGGVYPESIEADVSAERLGRFFTKEDHSYRVAPELRDCLVFATHDLLTDAPFSRLDLISCRNLLIYLRPEVQERVLALFHFALLDQGILFLGPSEAVGTASHRFVAEFKRERIFRRVGRVRPGEVEFPIGLGRGALAPPTRPRRSLEHAPGNFADLARQALLDAYAPAAVLINQENRGLYYFGPTDRYLRIPPGEASHDVISMAREGLHSKLRVAIRKAIDDDAPSVFTGARVERDGETVRVTVRVQPVPTDGGTLLLVGFIDEPRVEPHEQEERTDRRDDASVAEHLERELEATRKELQATINELEISNEELTAANEEAMSMNEEFQSTNEELETSKEELQSLNEELTTLNAQLQETVELQRESSNDLLNLLVSSDIATVFLDASFNIKRFTPAAKKLFNVIASDTGRPIVDLSRKFEDPVFFEDIEAVLADLVPITREVRSDAGAWFNRRILPYRTEDNRIEGVVVTFTDISVSKTAEIEVNDARVYAESIVDTVREGLVVLDRGTKIVSANPSVCRIFSMTSEQAIGRDLHELADGTIDTPELRRALQGALAEKALIEDLRIDVDLPGLGPRVIAINGREILRQSGAEPLILLAIEDVTERQRAHQALSAAKQTAEAANAAKSEFLAAVSHDLRQPLQTLDILQGVLVRKVEDQDVLRIVNDLGATLGAMTDTLNTLLDIDQLENAAIEPEITDFSASELLGRMRDQFADYVRGKGLNLRIVKCDAKVRSDLRLLARIVQNLLSNAVKYTNAGKILLGCRRRGPALRIEVWDSGIGIPDDQLDAVFNKYHRVGAGPREPNSGLGLGLSVVRRMADLLGHRLDVRSTPGQGSMFAVEVPMSPGEEGLDALPLANRLAARNGRQVSVLLVEDDASLLRPLRILLELEGYQVITARAGDQARAAVEQHEISPMAAIIDYSVSGEMSGSQFIRGLRKAFGEDIPIIVLTGVVSTLRQRKISELGARYLQKPVRAAELIALLREMLEHAGLGRSRTEAPSVSEPIQPPGEPVASISRPTVFVVDDDETTRNAMRTLFESVGHRVETFASGEAFLGSYHPGRSGCMVVDIVMPGISGLELLEKLNARGIDLPVVVITGRREVPLAVRAMRAGAVDFLEKPVRNQTLLNSIHRALDQKRRSKVSTGAKAEIETRFRRLTRRECEVMALVVAGHANKIIAGRLGISQRTVENHRARVMEKMNARVLADLVRMATAIDIDKWSRALTVPGA
jgi:two-component system CheB/CheR fusion protein